MSKAHSSKANKKSKESSNDKIKVWPLYLIVVILFVLYIALQRLRSAAIVIGILLFFMIIITIVVELLSGGKEEGYKKSIIEIVIALVIVVAFWYALRFILQTNDPIDVVPSCSMLPVLHRGDMIVLEGVKSISQIKAPVINVTNAQMAYVLNHENSESLECVAYYVSPTGTQVDQIIKPGYKVGLLESTASGYYIVSNSSQAENIVKYICGSREIAYANGTTANEAYTEAIIVNNITVKGDKGNSIIVYKTNPNDLFYKEGDSYIVHRVYAVLNDSGNYYFLTKGDNNPGLDMQYENYPAGMDNVSGKVIASVPYLGYIKLILSNDFVQPQGCNSTVVH